MVNVHPVYVLHTKHLLFANVRFVHRLKTLLSLWFRSRCRAVLSFPLDRRIEREFSKLISRIPKISKKKKRRRKHRYRILHAGTIIPATKIVQVDLLPQPLLRSLTSRRIPLRRGAGGGTGQLVSIGGTRTRSAPFQRLAWEGEGREGEGRFFLFSLPWLLSEPSGEQISFEGQDFSFQGLRCVAVGSSLGSHALGHLRARLVVGADGEWVSLARSPRTRGPFPARATGPRRVGRARSRELHALGYRCAAPAALRWRRQRRRRHRRLTSASPRVRLPRPRAPRSARDRAATFVRVDGSVSAAARRSRPRATVCGRYTAGEAVPRRPPWWSSVSAGVDGPRERRAIPPIARWYATDLRRDRWRDDAWRRENRGFDLRRSALASRSSAGARARERGRVCACALVRRDAASRELECDDRWASARALLIRAAATCCSNDGR